MTSAPGDVDWHALAATYNTDPNTLRPDIRERTDRALNELHHKLATGQTTPPDFKVPYRRPIGLDDNLQPYAPPHPAPPEPQNSTRGDGSSGSMSGAH